MHDTCWYKSRSRHQEDIITNLTMKLQAVENELQKVDLQRRQGIIEIKQLKDTIVACERRSEFPAVPQPLTDEARIWAIFAAAVAAGFGSKLSSLKLAQDGADELMAEFRKRYGGDK